MQQPRVVTALDSTEISLALAPGKLAGQRRPAARPHEMAAETHGTENQGNSVKSFYLTSDHSYKN